MKSVPWEASGTDRRIARQILSVATSCFASTLLAACTPPFPGPPETLPDCDFHPATEFCSIAKDSARIEAPFTFLHEGNLQNVHTSTVE